MSARSLLLFCVLSSAVVAQPFSHPLRAVNGSLTAPSSSGDTLRILAVMVQFQEDDDSRTSGTGRFNLAAPATPIIDAPPHDSSYVADHFLFASNYFRKVSNGRQHVAFTLLGSVLTLPQTMEHYAPIDDNKPLARMIAAAWAMADSANPGFPFSQYDMFVIVHAGVGKDVDLRGTIGYDPTPLDIPSLYFDLASLRAALGTGYNGIPVGNGSFLITNSAVLPETEVRTIPSVPEDVTLGLGMNGLFVATIASHLGLPDLFDTKSGKTAIGRFGLMDGQAIFSFLGICPPEPSAWEKASLGWTVPIDVFGRQVLSAPAAGLYDTGMDTVYRIPISGKEYFLAENRQRDAKQDGQTVWMRWNGTVVQKHFTRDEEHFSNTNIDSIYGTVIDVDEPDWDLPGFIDDNEIYAGGIILWHIDGSVIEQNRRTNTINADPEHRGIDVEEADGSQDIGQTYDLTDPGSGSEDGSPFDYWFDGNLSPVYTNEFSDRSHPNSLSNSFAKTHITLRNFSVSASRMTFEAQVGDSAIQLAALIKRSGVLTGMDDTPLLVDIERDGRSELVFGDGMAAYLYNERFTPVPFGSSGMLQSDVHRLPTVINSFFGNSDGVWLASSQGNNLIFTSLDSTAPGVNGFVVDAPLSTPVYRLKGPSGSGPVFAGTAMGTIIRLGDQAGDSVTSIPVFDDTVRAIALMPNGWVATDGDSLKNNSGASVSLVGKRAAEIVNARIVPGGPVTTIVRSSDNFIILYDAATLVNKVEFSVKYSGPSSLAVADIDRDGMLDIIVGTGPTLSAFNSNGSMLEHFPVRSADGGDITGGPVIVGLSRSSSVVLVFGSTRGALTAVNASGAILPGFPIPTGGIVSSPAVTGSLLAVASTDSSVYVWNVPGLFDSTKIYWNGPLADAEHSNFVENTGTLTAKSNELLPGTLAYNWPNPVYGGTTNIRYFLGRPATVTIKILSMAGELVDEFPGPSVAGLDNEAVWNVSRIQSGIYFAQITASGPDGEQQQIVKIAVVK